jgi:hypothetical protein
MLRVQEERLPVQPVVVPPAQHAPEELFLQDILPSTSHQNVLMIARKNQGKTTLIWDMLRRVHRDLSKPGGGGASRMRVIIIAPTHDKDKRGWLRIKRWLTETGIMFFAHDDFWIDQGYGRRQNLLREFERSARPDSNLVFVQCIDDQSFSGRDRSLASLITRNRHSGTITLMSMQTEKLVLPSAFPNFDDIILLHGCGQETIKHVCDKGLVKLPWELLWDLYENNTKEQYSFLVINKDANEYRRNWDVRLCMPEVDHTTLLEIARRSRGKRARDVQQAIVQAPSCGAGPRQVVQRPVLQLDPSRTPNDHPQEMPLPSPCKRRRVGS